MRKPLRVLVIGAVAALLAVPVGTAQALNADTLVTVGSPSSPFSPVPKVQCPAVTTTVGLTRVPEHLNQPPGSSNRGSIAVGS